MATLNKVQIIGRLGKDPDARYTGEGTAITTVSIATSERWKDKDGETKERTEWHRVVFHGPTAEIAAKYLKRGSLCYVEGKLNTRKWTDRDGQERYVTEIRVGTLILLEPKPETAEPQAQPRPAAQKPAPTKPATSLADLDDDIPF